MAYVDLVSAIRVMYQHAFLQVLMRPRVHDSATMSSCTLALANGIIFLARLYDTVVDSHQKSPNCYCSFYFSFFMWLVQNWVTTHSRTMASLVHMHTKPLSNDYYSELETDWMGRAGFAVYPSLTWCLNRCLGQWFFSHYCRHLQRKPVRTDFCCFVIDRKFQLVYNKI